MVRTLILVAMVSIGAIVAADRAAAEPDEAVRTRAAELVRQLDAADFTVRRSAERELRIMVQDKRAQRTLAGVCQAALRGENVSLEARHRLEGLARELPLVAEPSESLTPPQVDALFQQLAADDYSVRQNAVSRLAAAADNPKLLAKVLLTTKDRLAATGISADERRLLRRVWTQAWGAWLTCDPAQVSLPKPDDAQLARWVQDVAEHAGRTGQSSAERELMLALSHDEVLPRVKYALEHALGGQNLDEATVQRLTSILEWTRPALVAECWQGNKHTVVQHMRVNVPVVFQGAQRPSHFDRIDDSTAHCVSGNALSFGDYPVGVFFPHPQREGMSFQLLNLPTPRRRLAYEHSVERAADPALTERRRWGEISRRTLARYLAAKRPLPFGELRMVFALDPAEVSRFAGDYLLAVPDVAETAELIIERPLNSDDPFADADDIATPPNEPLVTIRADGGYSHHAAIALALATNGTRDAAPGLVKAIEQHRFLDPSRDAPEAIPWIALLAIAQRDPWPDVDAWLEKQLDSRERLNVETDVSAEVAAAAALLLAERHGGSIDAWELEPVESELLTAVKCPAVRFPSEEKRAAAKRWWAMRKATLGSRTAP